MVQVSTHVIVRLGWFRLKIVEKFPVRFIKIIDEIGNGVQKALSQFVLLQCNAFGAQTNRDAT